jgi:hypothetical protein
MRGLRGRLLLRTPAASCALTPTCPLGFSPPTPRLPRGVASAGLGAVFAASSTFRRSHAELLDRVLFCSSAAKCALNWGCGAECAS